MVKKKNKGLSRFFIKDTINIDSMGNPNNQDNVAASKDVEGKAESDGGRIESKNVLVDSKGQIVEEGKPLQAPVEKQPEENTQPVEGDVSIEGLIKGTQEEIKEGEQATLSRVEKSQLLTRAINSRHYFENLNYINTETGEQPVEMEGSGNRIRYGKDPKGKSIYDYMNDPEVTKHIGFKVPEDDPKDGSIVTKQITVFWTNPEF